MVKIYFVCWKSMWLYSSEFFLKLSYGCKETTDGQVCFFHTDLYYFTVEHSFSEDLNFSEGLSFSEELSYSEFYITRLQTYLNCVP